MTEGCFNKSIYFFGFVFFTLVPIVANGAFDKAVTGFRMKSLFKPKYILMFVLLGGLVLAGCTGGSAPLRGWSGVAASGGNLYLGAMDGRVVAVNTANGSLIWTVPVVALPSGGGGFGCAPAAAPVAIYSTPAVAGDLVYISGYDGKLYAISASTRLSTDKYLRKDDKSSPQPIIGSPVVVGGNIYTASSDGVVYAKKTVSLNDVWQFATGDKIWSSPAVAGGTLYVTSFDKKIYAVNTADGSKKWEFKTEGAIVSSPVVDGDTVYFGSLDRNIYALNAADGSLRWKFGAGKWFWATPIVHNGVVYAANLDGKVYALNTESGQKQVEFDLKKGERKDYGISSSPVMVDNLLIVATEAGKVYSLDTVNNQQKQVLALGEKVYAGLAAADGKVYVHSAKDRLYEIEVSSGAKRELNIK